MKSKIIDQDIKEIVKEFKQPLSNLSGKKILITGGNGFLGSYLVDIFIEMNKELEHPCKILILNKNEITEKSRLSHLKEDKNITFIVQDIGEHFELPKGINIIFHAASTATPTSFLKDPIGTIDSNINGTRTLLEYAKTNPVDNFLFFSSSFVYGTPNPKFIPTPEDYTGNVNPIDSISCYSESKRFSETLCSIFFREYSIPIKILRIGHTYGPGLREDKAIHEFFSKSINDKVINLKDSGKAHIGFCYITDTIRGILKVMFNGLSGEAYNVSNDFSPISINNLAQIIGELQNNNTLINPNYNDKEDKSIKYIRCLDISKLKKLDFESTVSIEDGLYRLKEHINEVGL